MYKRRHTNKLKGKREIYRLCRDVCIRMPSFFSIWTTLIHKNNVSCFIILEIIITLPIMYEFFKQYQHDQLFVQWSKLVTLYLVWKVNFQYVFSHCAQKISFCDLKIQIDSWWNEHAVRFWKQQRIETPWMLVFFVT